ncbi:hypothetical protein [Chitinophaga sp. MM2321]|uniref:hypothetical protein n=1 Tax=Chitinophaga sp. MM2321 TaxID=3137178 RepID=UPI0032D59B14
MNLEPILKYTGIAGLAITLLFFLFKDIIRKNIFSRLNQKYSYQILRLIILLIFFASIACIIGYFYTQKAEATGKNEKDTINVDDHHIESNGDNNTNISGSNIVVNLAGTVPTYDIDKIEVDSFAEFLEENDQKIINLNILMDAVNHPFPGDDTTIEGSTFSKTSLVVEDAKENDDGGYTNLVFSARSKSPHTYINGDKEIQNYYWTEDETECTVIINKINKDLVYFEHGFIIVKGRYLIKYYLGGQGHHVATLTPKETT